jgi:hypothetical protein
MTDDDRQVPAARKAMQDELAGRRAEQRAETAEILLGLTGVQLDASPYLGSRSRDEYNASVYELDQASMDRIIEALRGAQDQAQDAIEATG